MRDWIEKNVDPPGMEKPRLGSLFSAVGRIFELVKNDAQTAFRAHFPYLADLPSLRRHGKSLGIPEFPFDREDEFRERVSAASHYLSRAGERGYILDRMRGHFGDDFVLTEEFLRVYVDIAEMDEEDRVWVRGFLDGILDPNIMLTVSELFRFVDEMEMGEELRIQVERRDADSFGGDLTCDGRFLCDQGREVLCDGSWDCDGSRKAARWIPARGTVFDEYLETVTADGSRPCDGSWDCSGAERIFFPSDTGTGPVLPRGDFTDSFAATLELAPMADEMAMGDGPLALQIIKLFRCDGLHRPSCSVCDGSIICDGSYAGYDGKFYSGDTITKEVLA